MSERTTSLLACSAAALLAGGVYLNALSNPFVYDDYRTVVSNPTIGHITELWPIVLYDRTRPLTNLSFAVDRTIWGSTTPLDPFGFHVTNVLLHMCNVVLLFGLARSLAYDRAARTTTVAPFFTAALLAVHPVMTEAVGYISGRFEVLSTTFFLGALLSARRWLGGRSIWTLPTFALWIAALASKETAVVLPVIVGAWDYWMPDRRSRFTAHQRLRRVHLPLVLFAVVVGLARLAFLAAIEYRGQTAIEWRYATIVLDVVRRYLWLLVNPTGQTAFHAVGLPHFFSGAVLLALAVLGGAAALIWHNRGREPRVSVGLIWFLAALLPSSALILLDRGEAMAEHRVYLASGGLFIAAGAGAERLWGWSQDRRWFRPWLVVGAALVLMSFGLETVLRNQVWGSPVELWREAVVRAPAHPRPRLLLGEALHDAGRRDEAIVQFERAIALRPDDAMAHLKLGQALAEVGRFDAARTHLQRALQLSPGDPAARHSLNVLEQLAEGARQ